MEKTTHIRINATSFQLTETAYQKLNTYLEKLKSYFAHENDSNEIIRDIESRIAEKLTEKGTSIITETEISNILSEIGDTSQFDQTTEDHSSQLPQTQGQRKLYRDTDDVVIMGVASGIAAYFNIDPVYVRTAFVISIFFGGLGIALYVILSLLVPPAESASQKLEMRGVAVTIDSISRTIKDRADEVKSRGTFTKIVLLPITILGVLSRFLHRRLLPLTGKILGFGIIVCSFLATLGLTGLLTTIAVNWDKIDIPLRELISHTLLWTDISAMYIAVIIPLLFILVLGYKLAGRRAQTFGSAVGFGLVGVWCLAVIVVAATTTRIVNDYSVQMNTNPEYKEITQVLDLPAFEAIKGENVRITLRHGENQSVTLEGRARNFDLVETAVADNTLSITARDNENPCLFCEKNPPRIIITTPYLNTLTVKDSSIYLEALQTPSLNISTESSSVRGDIITNILTIISRNSHIELDGKTDSTEATIRNSSLNIENLIGKKVNIDSIQSFARVHASSTLIVTEDDSSSIQQKTNDRDTQSY